MWTGSWVLAGRLCIWKNRNSKLLIRECSNELLTCAYSAKELASECAGGCPSAVGLSVNKQESRTAAPWSNGSSIWLSTALTSCLPTPALPFWPPLTSLVWCDNQRCALFIERCVHLSVCHGAKLHLHLRTVVAVTLSDVHRQAWGVSSVCCCHVSLSVSACLDPVEQPCMPSLHHRDSLCILCSLMLMYCSLMCI